MCNNLKNGPWLVYVKCPLHIGLLIGVDISHLHIYNSPEVVGVFLWERMGMDAPHQAVVAVAVKEIPYMNTIDKQ